MASLVTRTRADGGASYRVVWRKGGGRSGPQAGETFADETQAASFKLHVDAAGNDWPVGWTPGQGWVAADDCESVDKLLDWGSAWIVNLIRPSADAKDRYTTQLTTFCEQAVALVHAVPTVQNVTEDHVVRWINWRREQPIGSSPKTISNYHGMLSSLFAAAIKMDLRKDNPCDGHRLPDRNTVNADGDAPELHFLSEEQFALIADCMFPDEMYDRGDTGRSANGYLTTAAMGHWAGMIEDRWLIEADVLTGMRWGEITALKVKDVELVGTAMSRRQPFVQIRRAWKRNPTNGSAFHKEGIGQFYLGTPKTKKSRRKISLSAEAVRIFAQAMTDKQPDDFVFTAPMGGPQLSGTWYEGRWQKAVGLAIKRGMTVKPRFHDLRHTHVAWLIALNTPLPIIQARLGHESITTTIDVYGGLLMTNDDETHAGLDNGLRGHPIHGTAATLDPARASRPLGAADNRSGTGRFVHGPASTPAWDEARARRARGGRRRLPGRRRQATCSALLCVWAPGSQPIDNPPRGRSQAAGRRSSCSRTPRG